MIVFLLEDEPVLLRHEEAVLKEALPGAEVKGFALAKDAMAAIEAGTAPDVVFSDIEMPGVSGLAFAVRLKTVCPGARIIFVTGYPQYAVEAYRLHAGGYIMKPLEPGRVREEVQAVLAPVPFRADRLQVRCFGEFEVFWMGRPLMFDRRQTKELFAFLIDHQGRLCTSEEIIAALWENESNMKAAKTRVRNLVFDLKQTLEKIGMGRALIRKSGLVAVSLDLVDCDYYRLLQGDMTAVNEYRGEYMKQYSWAEITAGTLYFNAMR